MSPLDPVFWTHHNMVECCWVHWNIVRSHPNTNDPAWTDHAFVGNFVDRHGNPADVRVSDTLLYPLLLYRFEECFAGPPGAEDMRAAERRMDLEVFLKRGARVTLDFIEVFEMQGEMDMSMGTSFTRTIPMKRQGIEAMLAPNAKHQLLLLLDGVRMPKNSQSFVRVFANKADATSNTSIDDPHYAGSFSIFDTRQEGAEKQGQFIVDVTKTIRRLQSMGQLGTLDKIDIQMIAVPVPGAKDESPRIRVDKLRLGISRPVELH